MKRHKNIIIFLFLYFGMFIPFAFAQINDDAVNSDMLNSARRYVEQKSYDEAIQRYSRISSWLRTDPNLLIEWARVYTYADRHSEAIKIFEEIRKDYPGRTKEILRELADQYKWSGRQNKAVEVYREILKNNPTDSDCRLALAQSLAWSNKHKEALTEYDTVLDLFKPGSSSALIAKAEVLSWMDRLEEAAKVYQQVLEKDPGNVTALIGRSRMYVWEGYRDKGIAGYKEVLRRYPNNLDAMEALATALHWDGRDKEAIAELDKILLLDPKRKSSITLYRQIKTGQRRSFDQFNGYSRDNNHQTVLTDGSRAIFRPDYSTVIQGIYAHQLYRKNGAKDPTINANRGGLAFIKSFSDKFEVNSFSYLTHFNKVDYNPFTTDTWFTYKPADSLRFDLSYNRQTIEDNDALTNKIMTNGGSLSMDYQLNRRLLFAAKYGRFFYNDDNRQNVALAKLEYKLFQKPNIKLFYNYYFSNMAEPLLSHGYFNPRSIKTHTLGAYASKDITDKLFVAVQASGGYEFQRVIDVLEPVSNHPTYFIGSDINYRVAQNWLFSLHGEYFNARPDSHNTNGYIKQYYGFSFTHDFGLGVTELPAAQQPSRPITGSEIPVISRSN